MAECSSLMPVHLETQLFSGSIIAMHLPAPRRTRARVNARSRWSCSRRGAAMRGAWSHPSKSGEVHSGQLLFSRCVQLLQPCSSNCDTAPLTERKTCRARRPPTEGGYARNGVRAGLGGCLVRRLDHLAGDAGVKTLAQPGHHRVVDIDLCPARLSRFGHLSAHAGRKPAGQNTAERTQLSGSAGWRQNNDCKSVPFVCACVRVAVVWCTH